MHIWKWFGSPNCFYPPYLNSSESFCHFHQVWDDCSNDVIHNWYRWQFFASKVPLHHSPWSFFLFLFYHVSSILVLLLFICLFSLLG
jgi:hypothetical protein